MSNLVTGKVRFSYANVFEPRITPNGDEKYSVTLLLPKSDTESYQNIMTAINNCIQENLADTFKGVMPANLRLPVYDGDGLKESGAPFEPECKGCWVIPAKSNTTPEVVDANVNPIISKNEFYSGCYGRASIRFYAYSQNGNKGIGCGLGNVQKLEDGQPLDGRTTAAEDFGAPTQNAAMPATPVAQTAMPVQTPQPQYQAPVQSVPGQYQMPAQPDNYPVVNPSSGQPMQTPTLNNIYGVN